MGRVTQNIMPIMNQLLVIFLCKFIVYGFFVLGAYLIVITKRYKVGGLMGHTVWRVGGTELLCYKRSTSHLTEQQVTFIFLQTFTFLEVMWFCFYLDRNTATVELSRQGSIHNLVECDIYTPFFMDSCICFR